MFDTSVIKNKIQSNVLIGYSIKEGDSENITTVSLVFKDEHGVVNDECLSKGLFGIVSKGAIFSVEGHGKGMLSLLYLNEAGRHTLNFLKLLN